MYPWWKFEKDMINSKGFIQSPPQGYTPRAPLGGRGTFSQLDSRSLNSLQICIPDENLSYIWQIVKDLPKAPHRGILQGPPGGSGVHFYKLDSRSLNSLQKCTSNEKLSQIHMINSKGFTQSRVTTVLENCTAPPLVIIIWLK